MFGVLVSLIEAVLETYLLSVVIVWVWATYEAFTQEKVSGKFDMKHMILLAFCTLIDAFVWPKIFYEVWRKRPD